MKLIIHNFYGRSAPSGENEVVRQKKREFTFRHFKFSDSVQKRGLSVFLWAILWRKNKALMKLIRGNSNELQVVEIHNTFPALGLSFIRFIPYSIRVRVYLHNFRYIAPCGVLMDRSGKSCHLCVTNMKAGLSKSLRQGCYRSSRLLTLFIHLKNYYYRAAGVFQRIDEVVTFSDYHLRAISPSLRPTCKQIIVSNSVTYLQNVARNSDTIDGSVVYMGRLSAEKGVVQLMSQWQDHVELPPLIIYGAGADQRVVAEIANNSSNLKYMGFADVEEKRKALSRCVAIIIPSVCAEGYPVSLAEAVSLRIPVIVNDVEPLASHCADLKHLKIDVDNLNPVSIIEFLSDA